MANEADFKFRSQFWAAYAPQPEPEPEPEPGMATCPPTRNHIVLQGHGRSGPALEVTVDELTLDDVEKDPSGNWTLAQYSGLMLWDAATIFARWMHRYAAQVFAGRSVLELGAGSTGLPGLTAHLLGARNVVLSDHIPELVQSLRANIRRCQEGVATRVDASRARPPGQIQATTVCTTYDSIAAARLIVNLADQRIRFGRSWTGPPFRLRASTHLAWTAQRGSSIFSSARR